MAAALAVLTGGEASVRSESRLFVLQFDFTTWFSQSVRLQFAMTHMSGRHSATVGTRLIPQPTSTSQSDIISFELYNYFMLSFYGKRMLLQAIFITSFELLNDLDRPAQCPKMEVLLSAHASSSCCQSGFNLPLLSSIRLHILKRRGQ